MQFMKTKSKPALYLYVLQHNINPKCGNNQSLTKDD